MKPDAETEAEITALIDEFAEAYSRRDADAVMAFFADDADLVHFGTGADERRIGPVELRAQYERDFAQSDSIVVKRHWISVSARGPVAWATIEWSTDVRSGDQITVVPVIRATLVLEKRRNRWQFVHKHTSRPASEQPEGRSWPT